MMVYIDDILITRPDDERHLKEVLRLDKVGLRAKESKCKFMAST